MSHIRSRPTLRDIHSGARPPRRAAADLRAIWDDPDLAPPRRRETPLTAWR